ncbi:MAG: hypothetical protein AAGA58_06500 [Verrucomicrobiota bacterium]
MSNYIPQSDGEFETWQANFVSQLADGPETYGLTAEQVNALGDLQTPWNSAYDAWTPAQEAAKAATTAKNESRAAFEGEIRNLAQLIQANDDVTDEARDLAGLPVHKTTRTPVPPPDTQPELTLETGIAFQHKIYFRDKNAAHKAKPKGVTGCEIWCNIGNHPAGPEECHFIGLDTKSPHVTHFTAADTGQTAYYARWINTTGQPGPWSEVVEGTIGG